MKTKDNRIGSVKLVFQPTHPMVKVIVLIAILLSTAALVALGVARQDARARTAALQEQAAQLEQANNRLVSYIEQLDTEEGIQRIAAEELGLVRPGTVVFHTESNAD